MAINQTPEERGAGTPKKVDWSLFTTVGGSGTKNSAGQVWNDDDYNPDLQNSAGMLVWEKMRASDGQVAGSIAHIVLPFLSAHWRIAPGGEKPKEGADATPEAIKIAEKCSKYFFNKPIVDGHCEGWDSFIRLAISMSLVHGFMAFEKVSEIDEDGTWYYKKLAPRLPKSVWYFEMESNGDLKSLVQYAWLPDGKYAKCTIPAKKLVLFVPFKEGDNYWGRSILRPAYIHWYMKRQLMNFDGMRHERHGVGVPVLKIPPGADAEEHKAAEKILAELRANERQYVKIPSDWDFDIKYPSGTATDIIGSCNYHDNQIGRSTLTELMSLGASISGSRSLGQAKQDTLLLSLQGLADYFCFILTHGPLREFVDNNFGPQEFYPKFEVEDLDTMAPLVKANLLQLLTNAEVVRPDDKLEDYARKVFYLPKRDPDTARIKVPPKPFGGDPNNPEDPVSKRPRPSGPNQKPAAGGGNFKDRATERTKQLADFALFKEYVLPVQLAQAEKFLEVVKDKEDDALRKFDGVATVRPLHGRLSSNVFTVLKECYLSTALRKEDDPLIQNDLKKLRELSDGWARTSTLAMAERAYIYETNCRMFSTRGGDPKEEAESLAEGEDIDKFLTLTTLARQCGMGAGGGA